MIPQVKIWSDGSCREGIGGWAAVIKIGDETHEISGSEADTTSSRMELMAAIKALEWLPNPSHVILFTDWVSLAQPPTRSRSRGLGDLHNRLDSIREKHYSLEIRWVKGHSGVPENMRAHWLAGAARSKIEPRSHEPREAIPPRPAPRPKDMVQERRPCCNCAHFRPGEHPSYVDKCAKKGVQVFSFASYTRGEGTCFEYPQSGLVNGFNPGRSGYFVVGPTPSAAK